MKRVIKIYNQSMGPNYTQVPTILLKGQWLRLAGFESGEYVEVQVDGDKITLTKTKAPVGSIAKILIASAIMGAVAYIIPKTTLFLFPGIFLCIVVYFFALILVKFFQKDDIASLRAFSSKFGPLSKIINKMLNFVERIEFR